MKPSASIAAATGSIDPIMLEVRSRFIADFPMRCDVAASLVDRPARQEPRAESSESLRTLAHRLAGLAGIVGFSRVSALASDLEDVAAGLETGTVERHAAHAVI